MAPDQCECFLGYQGSVCSQYWCRYNCSNNGNCIGRNKCACNSQYTGSYCATPLCTSLNNCNKRGVCVSPNVCQCNERYSGADCSKCAANTWSSNCFMCPACIHGTCDFNTGTCICNSKEWIGDLCSESNCISLNNCSYHGTCSSYNVCICNPLYACNDCSQCSNNTWGPNCLPCPQCKNGFCDKTNGICICNGNNWIGQLCDTCAKNYYGSNCLALPTVTQIAPPIHLIFNKNYIIVTGNNFNPNQQYNCLFGNSSFWIKSNAEQITPFNGNQRFMCFPPQFNVSTVVDFALGLQNASDIFLTNYSITFIDSFCHSNQNQCGELRNQGSCTNGQCVCSRNWGGDKCDQPIQKPLLSPIDDIFINETESLWLNITLIAGTSPIYTQLITNAPNLILESENRLHWDRAIGS